MVREEDAKAQGLLDGITWEEYKLNNQGKTKIDVDQELYNVVANATGISADRITIVAYRENRFFDKQGPNITATDVVQIVLVIVILALLAFVVLRSMRGRERGSAGRRTFGGIAAAVHSGRKFGRYRCGVSV